MAATHPETALVPFIRGELSGAERDRIAHHLDDCGRCREAAESFQSLLAELPARVQELPTPEWTAYRAELRRKLAVRLEPRPRWWQSGLGWASMATAGAALAALALWFAIPAFHGPAPAVDEVAMEQPPGMDQPIDVANLADVGLLRNYGVVERLDLLENYDVIEHLDEIKPGPQGSNAARS
jgi:anti-sigma factor RsiW